MHFFKVPKEHSTVLTKRFTLYEVQERCYVARATGLFTMASKKYTTSLIKCAPFNFNFFFKKEKGIST